MIRALSPVDVWTKYDALEARLTAPLSERMLDLARVGPGSRVLDLATGRGEPAVRAAKRVGLPGRVLGTDIAPDMLAFARRAGEGTCLELREVDAQTGEGIESEAFDVVTSRWALMYMPEPARAVATATRALVPGGVLVAALWAEPERVSWATFARRILARHCAVPPLDLARPGACHHGSMAVVERDFAGLAIEHVEELETAVIEAPDAAGIAAWCIEFGLARLAEALPEPAWRAFEEDLVREAETLRVGTMYRLGGTSRIVLARRPRAPA